MKIDRFPLYEFSSDGYVVSLTRKNPFVMKPIKMAAYVGLSLQRSDGLIERVYLHRIIAEAFHGKCHEGMECRHLDGDKHNNASYNLSWGTRQQNIDDKILHGTSPKGELNGWAKLNEKTVLKMRKHREDTGESYKVIGKLFSVSTMTAFRAITKVSWSHI